MTQDDYKKAAALAAMAYVKPGMLVGVGTGSTTNYFIDALASMKDDIIGAIPSSKVSETRLSNLGIKIATLSDGDPDIYVDGADRFNKHLQLIKGGGGALTGEKIVATAAKQFICIADISKEEVALGKTFPLPLAVVPMARSSVARQLVKLGGDPIYRNGFTTDQGNIILDVHNLTINEPLALETQLDQMPGVVCNGLFAHCRADVLLIGGPDGVETRT